MNSQSRLAYFMHIAYLHAARLSIAFDEVKKLLPLTESKIHDATATQLAMLDMLTTRFCKLQDIIGAKIFPLILELLAEDAETFIDKLNRLEKLGYIASKDWWLALREIRNEITHDYPENYALLSARFNKLTGMVDDLLRFSSSLNVKITYLINRV